MTIASIRHFFAMSFIAFLLTGPAAGQESASPPPSIRDSVVRVITTYRAPDLHRPWTKHPPQEAMGTGVVIEGERILTNAHVAEHATRIQIQPANSTVKYVVEVEALGSGIDLALLRFRDAQDAEEFFADHAPLRLRNEIPQSGDRIDVYGYPIGGEQMSVTAGVVSRIDYTSYYSLTSGLMVQIDAAVNPGNSGGPAVHNGEMIGLVFSRMNQAENIGYVIPTEEILAFLDDVRDGRYDGRPRVMIGHATLEAKQVRDFLGLDSSINGVYVYNTQEWPELYGELQDWDVITAIGDYDIDNTGTVKIRDDLRLQFYYLTPHLVNDDGTLTLTVWRQGQEVEVKVPTFQEPPHALRFLGADYPPYFIYGPLCFMPAYANFIGDNNALVLAMRKSPLASEIFATQEFPDQEYVCVLSPMFTHSITEGYAPLDLPTLRSVNGIRIKSLAHLVETLRDTRDEWITFDWYDVNQENLVFRRADVLDATEEILEANGIRRQMSEEYEMIWEAE